ncbi:phenylacetyl- ligase [Pyrenophora seminiperda CCB06]|uniref:Phenylacetyl-ligase n=1 Tax=Pyrenophora seminiperda CCB06 TaxID=1302712 RepID=A0A3M7MH06_9PLEO|nr:phenylacetyl- ligase [Pyrenophora seminiperda CCB06]
MPLHMSNLQSFSRLAMQTPKMPFYPPSWAPKLPFDPPDSIPISEFILNDLYGRHPLGYSHNPFTCGLTGKTYTALEVQERVDYLARGLAKELDFDPNKGTEWDKVIAVFSVNTIDTVPLAWATTRLGGIHTPANAAYSASELEYQLKSSGAKALFTCIPLLETAIVAARKVGIPQNRIYILEVPDKFDARAVPEDLKTVDDLIREGSKLDRLPPLDWEPGHGAKRTAYLCYSSGTSGLPKGVMLSHMNVIANTFYEKVYRDTIIKDIRNQSDYTEIALGLLPMAHIAGLVAVSHLNAYRGDGTIVLPKYDFETMLQAVQDYKINTIQLAPPVFIQMINNKPILDKYDLSSVWTALSAAAPLGAEPMMELQKIFPHWKLRQAYGLTEISPAASMVAAHDIWIGSVGSLITSVECKLVAPDGTEITGYDQPGELLLKSPSVVLGYHNNEQATAETFQDGWLRTGDEAVMRKAPSGHEHLFIVDRIKELIKVQGYQVAPAELEAHLLSHPSVKDCAVIQVPNEKTGEMPKAFVVKSEFVGLEENDRVLAREICKYVEQHKARYKWLGGGVEFVDEIPKSPSSKILRRLLRDQEKEKRRQAGSKL